MDLAEFLILEFGGNYVRDYLLALAIFLITAVGLRLIEKVIVNRLRASAKTDFGKRVIKAIENIGWPLYFVLALQVSLRFIQLHDFIGTAVYYLTVIAIAYYVVRAIHRLIDYTTHRMILKRQKEDKAVDASAIDLLNKFLKISLWALMLILVLTNLGIDVTPLIAGLGIGGLAVAFALQNVLSDVFASFSIYFDKPFKTGDFIIIGEDMGVVKKIGIKSTRIQTLQGEELVVSNRELTETRVHNYKKLKRRRISFSFGVKYETPTEKLKKIPGIIKDIIDKIKLADVDRAHFKKFGEFSLNFEVIYYLNSSNYNDYMDTQQEINFAIKERFEKEGIELAYPTQTVFVNRVE